MARLWLDPHEWAEMREVILRVPKAQRDDKWQRAFEAVDAVCGGIACARGMLKDSSTHEDRQSVD